MCFRYESTHLVPKLVRIIENIFQSMMIVQSVELRDGIPQIKEYNIINEHFTDNVKVSLASLFESGLARRIYTDVDNSLWPFFLKNLVHESDHELIYPTLAKMVLKSKKKTDRNQLIVLCPLMEKVNPKFHGMYSKKS